MINTLKDSPHFSKKAILKTMRRGCEQDSSSALVKLSVSFGETDVRTIANREEYSNEEIRSMWYNDCEFQIMKLSIVHTLKKVIAGTYKHKIYTLESEVRGLENKTPKGSAARKKKRFASLFAVLDEQNRQRELGLTTDTEYIAELYRQSTAHCQAKAVKAAARDFECINFEDKEHTQKLPTVVQPPASPSSARTPIARTFASPLGDKSRSRRRLLGMMICK
eukprot:CAMPEP_0197275640 /NCGR_PEP_ID=MMETSP1432-20130617/14182_1 /TAXON_ID=44447 /ORGANISM="Pseudo-nitzschia delicatissima, Strain UNC1205" /LENGTH=221 /DNA_ID=CAMNT_0042741565 /DNA_START=35 /DNA_END=700 /DNA_ORIENTATION=+